MNIEVKNNVAIVREPGVLIVDAQSAMDLLAAARYESGCSAVLVPKEAVCEDFFRLSTGLAGEVLQKFTNYRMKIAIVGDFSGYASKPLRDFIYESNQGKSVFFLDSEAEALEKLSGR